MPKLSFTAASKKGANCRLGYLVILHAVCRKTEKCSREEHLSALTFIFSARRLCFPCPSPSATLYVSGRPHVMKSWRDVWARRVRKSSSQPPSTHHQLPPTREAQLCLPSSDTAALGPRQRRWSLTHRELFVLFRCCCRKEKKQNIKTLPFAGMSRGSRTRIQLGVLFFFFVLKGDTVVALKS